MKRIHVGTNPSAELEPGVKLVTVTQAARAVSGVVLEHVCDVYGA